MTAPDRGNDSLSHEHAEDTGLRTSEAQCPYCGQPISRKQFREIRQRIEREGREHLTKAELALKEKFAHEQQQAATKAKAEIDKAKKDAAAQVEKAKRETAAREAVIRKEATQAATTALAPKIAEAVAVERKQLFAEKLRINEQKETMKREMERSRAFELADSGELDLLTALTQQFSAAGDKLTRVPKGPKRPRYTA